MNPLERRKMRLSWAVLAALALVAVAGAAVASAGIGSLVTSADDGARVNAAQEPIGTRSATPRAPAREPGGNQLPDDGRGELLGERGLGGAAPDRDAVAEQAVAGSGGSSKLPFTGFLAIPVLAGGALMLLAGVALGRRMSSPASV